MLAKSLSQAAGNAAQTTYVDDVFSTWLYNGNSSTQTITNGIDLAGEGGLVWLKSRSNISGHLLFDSSRGVGGTGFYKILATDTTAAESASPSSGLDAFLGSGFSLDTAANSMNGSAHIYTSWSFRNAPKFFTNLVVSHTNGTATNINLSSLETLGMVVAKITNTTGAWTTWHRSLTAGNNVQLNTTAAQSTTNAWLSVSGATATLASAAPTGTYVIYAWAHDAISDGLIQCGSLSHTLGAITTVTLGWEPQFLIIKKAGATGQWWLSDDMRGFTTSDNLRVLQAQSDATEALLTGAVWSPTSTGFTFSSSIDTGTYIYLAIRIPNKPPTSGTEVFQPVVYTGTNADNRLVNTGMKTDMVMARVRSLSSTPGFVVGDRLRGQPYLGTATTNAELSDADSLDQQIVSSTEYGTAFSSMTGFWVGNDPTANLNANTTTNNHIVEAFRRAPGFFDIVCDTGTGVTHTVSHNLAATPELMIRKKRSAADNWIVYAGDATDYLILNSTAATADLDTMWNDTAPTSSAFTVGTNDDVNQSAATFVTYLFASLPGISKVGSYTGNGTTQTIDCGFTTGARFVMIKQTSSGGSWFIFDAARGIVTGSNDPILRANLTVAELASDDHLNATPSGFGVRNTTTNNLNPTGETFIFLAIA
jgi:hypothetical protein